MNNRINRLDELTANKIAAGEVVDRPVSVVKELIENSIDAHSKNIIVEIRDGGKSYIRVSDDGCGIVSHDVEIAFERHATSKIQVLEDLNTIRSLGFRGEALASIASVSKIEMITCHESSSIGTHLRVANGNLFEKKEVGCPIGTTLIITDLFYNTPARLKFMKSKQVESAAIGDMVNKLALSHPNISFRFINNGSVIFSTPGSGEMVNGIVNIFGKDIAQNLQYFKGTYDIFSCDGYISKPLLTRGNRQQQIFFVNRRYVKSKVLNDALDEAYNMLVLSNRYPICFINLNIDPEYLDVNIHPTKTEIRIKDEEIIKNNLVIAIKDNLLNKGNIPGVFSDTSKVKTKYINEITSSGLEINPKQKTNDYDQNINDYKQIVMEEHVKYFRNNNLTNEEMTDPIKDTYVHTTTDDLKDEEESSIFDMKLLGQAFQTYIIGQDNNSIYLIDQHAAHERILFEELLCSYRNASVLSQNLITPMVIELSYSEFENTKIQINLFRKLGFDVEEFGINSFIIRAVPMVFGKPDGEQLFMKIVDAISSSKSNSYEMRIEKVILQACKAAIKAKDKLDEVEMRELTNRLSKLENPYTCPHGRPIIVSLTKNELERRFRRT